MKKVCCLVWLYNTTFFIEFQLMILTKCTKDTRYFCAKYTKTAHLNLKYAVSYMLSMNFVTFLFILCRALSIDFSLLSICLAISV